MSAVPTLDVAAILEDLGVEVVRSSGHELWALCPGHRARTGHEDTHPSWSINEVTYVHSCFSCGYSGNLTMLYADLLGEVPEDLEWELQKASVIASVKVKEEPEPVEDGPVINEWQLRNFGSVSDKLLDLRHLKRESVDLYNVRWHPEYKAWVLPIRLPDGELIGYQFKAKGYFDNYPGEVPKSECLFGFPQLADERTITVVESPLDAVRLHGLGIPAVSTYGANVSEAQVTLLARNYRLVVEALDNDAAGRKCAQKLHQLLHGKTTVIPFNYQGLPGKDVGDVPDDDMIRSAWHRSYYLLETS